MSYQPTIRQHCDQDGVISDQIIAPPDYPGDMNPPANNVATSRYTTACSRCHAPIEPGTPYLVGYCDGCNEPDDDDHTFVIGQCCDHDFADELAGNYLAIDAPLPLCTERR
jgi:hypothetical protein